MKVRMPRPSSSPTHRASDDDRVQHRGAAAERSASEKAATHLQASERMVAQQRQLESGFGPTGPRQPRRPLVEGAAPLQRKGAGDLVIQRQVDSGINDPTALTTVNWMQLMRSNRFKSYIYRNAPDVTAGQGAGGDTYLLVWAGAIEFTNGEVADLHIHMHEGVLDPDELAGGGAWVNGGAGGHGQNVGGVAGIETTCVYWINKAYASNCTVG